MTLAELRSTEGNSGSDFLFQLTNAVNQFWESQNFAILAVTLHARQTLTSEIKCLRSPTESAPESVILYQQNLKVHTRTKIMQKQINKRSKIRLL